MDFRIRKGLKKKKTRTHLLLSDMHFPVFAAKSCLFCKLGARPRQTAATATWAAHTPWTRRCCYSTASTTASRGTSSRSTSPRISRRRRGCPTTCPCKWPDHQKSVRWSSELEVTVPTPPKQVAAEPWRTQISRVVSLLPVRRGVGVRAHERREPNKKMQGRFLLISLSLTGISSLLEKNVFNFLVHSSAGFLRLGNGVPLVEHRTPSSSSAPLMQKAWPGHGPNSMLFQLLLEWGEAGRERETDSRSLSHQWNLTLLKRVPWTKWIRIHTLSHVELDGPIIFEVWKWHTRSLSSSS